MPLDSHDRPGIEVKGIGQLVEETLRDRDVLLIEEREEKAQWKSTLAGYISTVFDTNIRAREESGIKQEMINSAYQANGEYTPEELQAIEDEVEIYMGITTTKSRNGRSWLKEFIQPSNGDWPFSITGTPVEDVPEEIKEQIKEAFGEDLQRLSEELEKEFAQEPPAQPGQPPAQPGQPAEAPKSALLASKKLRSASKLQREVEEALISEIHTQSEHQIGRVTKKVEDSLVEGDWDLAMAQVIEDFTIYPTAFMKGPVVCKKKKLVWDKGIAKVSEVTSFQNKRVSPFDAYPTGSAATIYDGDFCEHLRLTKKDLSEFIGLPTSTGYYDVAIKELLAMEPNSGSFGIHEAGLEEDKARIEKRGSANHASVGIYHGVHFWGSLSVKQLRTFGYPEQELLNKGDWEQLEVEVIVVGSKIVKCKINADPLGRRPYYSASYQTRAGSIWGKSLPYLMRDIQKMCNACARSLADNMGMSSRPMCAILVDRLADDGDITDHARDRLWQFTSDPQGNGGKPIEYCSVPSHAKELMNVYDSFELKADDVTGIPRYAYGNDNVGAAAQTAKGLSMLLESASKGIKDSAKNFGRGIIQPRVKYEFYMQLLLAKENEEPLNYTGDVHVVVHATEAITIRAAEIEQQNELLKMALGSPQIMSLLGLEGIGTILRSIFSKIGLPEDAIPGALDLREKQKESEKKEAEQMKAQQQGQNEKTSAGVEAVKIQAQATDQANARSVEQKERESLRKEQTDNKKLGLDAARIEQQDRQINTKAMTDDKKVEAKVTTDKQKLAVDIQKNLQPKV